MNHCDPSEQQARQNLLDMAYALDGRDNPGHVFHLTYTGLAQTEAYKILSKANDTNY